MLNEKTGFCEVGPLLGGTEVNIGAILGLWGGGVWGGEALSRDRSGGEVAFDSQELLSREAASTIAA